ncbi:Peptidoglycan/LPS O-acetylase OafA/YrhL, contains acyltransferase and SGNH-hydrolase domains [Pseudomonas sp. NFACC23-1]|uniref:acyltransferase family protein n=1 Tax=unclassified Pseudomonas TaxID=196821 RepID=UPI00088A8CB8|nr:MULTISPECIES: acyltransferase family protein [unclassified Pseudomonas]SDB32655.1 Peptidoglycan/LPS O-acetylase OafA/YrhL, contains acyltransferase and SGNH-hydrolase domains [Pseudomonas sp. NFACC17-2]SEJ47082.1 Peptidoglycan/LPS O-acetylase OafA/YrhL, contains acyltransferase and SGNH-hydrolase domains [Pseudomonas sp. NFACC23-1]SFW57595.1 Peptidoglycan/LPS O-acetylase OafA/YrhL, contains acyltransferase and SGNH-hydrolase domains [Pseudomonas sp. NFACC16-2]
MHTFGNRRDIDGLRALAVIPVVLFHFGFSTFSGGFVGVDVFFVISGFLISSILFREMGAQRFSFIDFWARRARRILPALSLVLLATLVMGWWLLTAKDFSELGRTVRYQSLFISNILFMREDGYFEPASDLKPLLHTWSLAVEEQYYIFFPLLMLLMRHVRHWRWMLFAMLLISFGLNITYIDRKPDVTFFSLPTRAWELLCGAMLAVLPASRHVVRPWLYQLAGVAGLAAVLVAVFTFDRTTTFPGWAALLPVLGATALIWSGAQGSTWVAQLLGAKVLVWIGLISYSLYLWHWPIYVYANAVSIDGIEHLEAVGWILLALSLAWLSWRFVELPFREKRLLPGRKPVLVGGLLAMVALAVTGSVVRSADGFPQRLTGKALEYAQARDWKAGQMKCFLMTSDKSLDKACLVGEHKEVPATQLFWGDSHAAALLPPIESNATRARRPVWLYSMSACPPILSDDLHQRCKDFNERTMEQVRRLQIKDVVLASNWSLYVYGREDGDNHLLLNPRDNRAQAESRMAAALKARVALLRAAGVQVWLFKEVPLQRKNAIDRLTSLARVGRSTEGLGRPLQEHLSRQHFFSALFDSMSAADPGVHVIDPTPLMCPGQICSIEVNGHSRYKDEDHLSDLGSTRLRPLFAPVLLGTTDN